MAIRRPLLVGYARYRWDALRGEHQLLFPEGMLVLNDTGAAIAQRCDGRPLSDLLAALKADFPDGEQQADVTTFLDRLAAKGLLKDAAE
jgi:pyrroloquinoline quinone biosynthesis protein D